MNSFDDFEQRNDLQVPSANVQPLAEIEIRAPFLRLSVLLWNLFMTVFCVLIVLFAASKIVHGDFSIGIVLLLSCGTLLPIQVKAYCSSFGGKISIYQNRITQANAFTSNTVRFNNTFFMVHNPKFAGGKVLYLTEKEPNSFLKRLRIIFFLSEVMIIHIWMLTDSQIQEMSRLFSDLSGRPDSTFISLGGYQPFYLRTVEYKDKPTL